MAHLLALVSNEKVKKKQHLYEQISFRACDWLLFLFTIITLRRSYDEFVTILWSSYDFSKIGLLDLCGVTYIILSTVDVNAVVIFCSRINLLTYYCTLLCVELHQLKYIVSLQKNLTNGFFLMCYLLSVLPYNMAMRFYA